MAIYRVLRHSVNTQEIFVALGTWRPYIANKTTFLKNWKLVDPNTPLAYWKNNSSVWAYNNFDPTYHHTAVVIQKIPDNDFFLVVEDQNQITSVRWCSQGNLHPLLNIRAEIHNNFLLLGRNAAQLFTYKAIYGNSESDIERIRKKPASERTQEDWITLANHPRSE